MRHAKHAFFAVIFTLMADPAQADSVGPATGLSLPRFVSLKVDRVNMHVGPAKTYEVKWVYQRAGLPVEITAEFENWRRIRDVDGTEGWVYHSLLSGRRTGVVTAKEKDALIALYESADLESAVVAKLEAGVLASIKGCRKSWCHIAGKGFDGWIQQVRLWGVYPDEKLN